MKKLLKLFLLLLLISSLISCGAPPERAVETSLFKRISILLSKLNSAVGNAKEQKKIFNEIGSDENILSFYKDSEIRIFSKKDKVSDLFYSLDNNSFIIKKPFYITFIKNDMYLSLDCKDWLIFKMNDANQNENTNEEYFFGDYFFDVKYDENNKLLDIIYTISFKLKEDKLKKADFKKIKDNREIVFLEKGMIFNDKSKEAITIDLKKKILFIPKDTILTGKLKLKGNIFESSCDNNAICIKTLKNIFIYAKNKLLSLSFNKIDWNISILSFKISPDFIIKTTDSKDILFDFSIEVNYKER